MKTLHTSSTNVPKALSSSTSLHYFDDFPLSVRFQADFPPPSQDTDVRTHLPLLKMSHHWQNEPLLLTLWHPKTIDKWITAAPNVPGPIVLRANAWAPLKTACMVNLITTGSILCYCPHKHFDQMTWIFYRFLVLFKGCMFGNVCRLETPALLFFPFIICSPFKQVCISPTLLPSYGLWPFGPNIHPPIPQPSTRSTSTCLNAEQQHFLSFCRSFFLFLPSAGDQQWHKCFTPHCGLFHML